MNNRPVPMSFSPVIPALDGQRLRCCSGAGLIGTDRRVASFLLFL
jgi:hypothetical protein